MQNLNNLLKILLENKIDFVLIGGYAAVLYGSSQVTQDIDICASLSLNDLEKLRNALRPLHPTHRINPSVQPSLDDYPKKGELIKNYYLKTDQGVFVLSGQPPHKTG